MCFSWTFACTSGPIWVVGSTCYKAFWDSQAELEVGTITICDRGNNNQISEVDSSLVECNPCHAADIFSYPPPLDCNWHVWRFLHKLQFDQKLRHHDIALAWNEMSARQDREMLAELATCKGTCDDPAVLFCWLNGFNIRKSGGELVHHYIDLTARDLRQLRKTQSHQTLDHISASSQARRLIARGYLAFLQAIEQLRDDATCVNCAKVRTCRGDQFLRCGGCLTVRYCSVGCQAQHWNRQHKFECKRLRSSRE